MNEHNETRMATKKYKPTEELHKTQKWLERLEKEKIRNSLVITEIQVDTK